MGYEGETTHIWLKIKFVSYINGTGVCGLDSPGSGWQSAFEKWCMRKSTGVICLTIKIDILTKRSTAVFMGLRVEFNDGLI